MANEKKIRKKVYRLVSPEGVKYETFNLSAFCREHNINRIKAYGMMNGKIESVDGWTGRKGMKTITIKYKKRGGATFDYNTHPQKKSADYYMEKFIARHGDRYDYRFYYEDFQSAKKKVRIICRTHGIFSVTPHEHGRPPGKGGDCPRCSKSRGGDKPVKREYRLYSYKCDDGSIALVDKYQRGVLKELLGRGLKRDQIVIWDDWSKQIYFKWYKDYVEKTMYPYRFKLFVPDFYIPEEKLIIYPILDLEELKDPSVLAKREECIRRGYHFQMWKMTKGGYLYQIYL